MKVLHLSYFDIWGGAARSAYRLHWALIKIGIESLLLCQRKLSDDNTVVGEQNNVEKLTALIRPTIDRLPLRFYKKKSDYYFSINWLPFGGVIEKINKIKPDIVHIHWISNGMLRIEDLMRIRQPIVWTLHDGWAFSGGCHLLECDQYKSFCKQCVSLGSKKKYDLSSWIWRRKYKAYTRLKNNLIPVAVSSWIKHCAEESELFKRHKIIKIPNGIDTELFKPINKAEARSLWNLPIHKNIILFGAVNAIKDKNKGFYDLLSALNFINNKETEVVIYGCGQPKEKININMKTHFVGKVYDEISMVTLYNAADIVVVPSKKESLPLAACEAMACGTPVVAFATSGLNDAIEHKETGYLAHDGDSYDLYCGISWVLDNLDKLKLNKKSREKAIKCYNIKLIAEKYLSVYQELVNNKAKSII